MIKPTIWKHCRNGRARRRRAGDRDAADSRRAGKAGIALADLKRVFACMALAVSVLLFGSGGTLSASNSAIDQKKQEQRDVNEQLDGVQQERQGDIDENEQLLGEKEKLEGQKANSELTYGELLAKLRYYEAQIESANNAFAEAQAMCGEQEELFKSSVRGMYVSSGSSALEMLVSSRDVTSFLEKLELYAAISEHDKSVLEDYKSALADVEYKRSVQMAVALETEAEAAAQRQEIDELSVSRDELVSRIDGLQAKIDQLDGLEGELQRQSKQLEGEIRALVEKAEAEAAAKAAAEAKAKAEAAAKAKAKAASEAAEKAAEKAAADAANASQGGAGGEGGEGGGSGSSASSGNSRGSMRWPLAGYSSLSSPFGSRVHPVTKKKTMHTGIDIPAPTGASITAALGGTVIIAGTQGGYGNTVVLSHGDGITTLYGHCSKLLVKSGQQVKAGAVIAKVGSTGVSTGPHLHFEVRKDGSPVQPLNYVKAG
jgi:murein DD-endopeptidase MepM/ murein hydrolase activator NlpD